MKNIFFITFCSLLSCNIIWGQCSPLQVSTNPENSFNHEVGVNVTTSPYFNNFDWLEIPDYNPANYVLSTIESPFENTSNIHFFNKLSTDTGIKDYYVENGWELLNENITSSSQTDIIYFTLYNKYSSTIRVLFAMEEPPTPFNFVSIKLRFPTSEVNAMFHPSGAIGQPLDQSSTESVFVSVPMATNDFHFMMADFPVEYDPCVCFKEGLSKIEASFELLQQQIINLTGTLLSMNTNIANVANGTGNLDIGEFLLSGTADATGNVTAGTLIFESIDGLINEYDNLKANAPNHSKKLANLQKAKKALSIIAATAAVTATVIGTGGGAVAGIIGTTLTMEAAVASMKLAKNSKATAAAFKATADIAKGLSPFSDFFSYKANAEKSASSGAINKVGSVGVNFGALTLNGQINTSQLQSTGFSMAIPGGESTTPNLDSDIYPKYDNVLGRLAVLKTPTVEIGRQQSIDNNNNADGIKYTDRVYFDASTFEYVFNPAAGVSEDETVIFAGLEIIATKTGSPNLLENEFYNINFDDIEETTDQFIFNSEFVPLDCLSDLVMQLKYLSREERSQFPYFIDLGDYTITAINVKLCITYAFDQIGISGTQNRAVQMITYPTKIVNTPYTQIPIPPSNNGNPISNVLDLNTNQHFTTNTTIFAWQKITINADLTAAAGVIVEIIAPEIVIEDGSIGTGIHIGIGFSPSNCSPLNPVSQSTVQSFCLSTDYKANQSKSAGKQEEKPIIDIETTMSFELSPNPVTNVTYVEIELPEEDIATMAIYNLAGSKIQEVITGELLSVGVQQLTIPTEQLSSGVYFLRLETTKGFNKTLKLIKL